MQKARVLPEPVWPRPRMSRPSSASGSVAAWIGNGSVMPACARADTSGAGTPRPAKDGPIRGSAAGRREPRSPAAEDSMDRTVKIPLSDSGGRSEWQPPDPWKPVRLAEMRQFTTETTLWPSRTSRSCCDLLYPRTPQGRRQCLMEVVVVEVRARDRAPANSDSGALALALARHLPVGRSQQPGIHGRVFRRSSAGEIDGSGYREVVQRRQGLRFYRA